MNYKVKLMLFYAVLCCSMLFYAVLCCSMLFYCFSMLFYCFSMLFYCFSNIRNCINSNWIAIEINVSQRSITLFLIKKIFHLSLIVHAYEVYLEPVFIVTAKAAALVFK